MEKTYNYLYKITNQINGKYYYGIHSTNNLNDGYFGSGSHLNRSIQKYGKENFKMEILEFRQTRSEISNLEKEIVNLSIILDPSIYNIRLGGDNGKTIGTSPRLNPTTGKFERVPINDPKYADWNSMTTGKVVTYSIKEDKYIAIPVEDYYSNKDSYTCTGTGRVAAIDTLTNTTIILPVDEYKNNKDRYITHSTGSVLVYLNGKYVRISQEEYNKGCYSTSWTGRKHSKETKEKISNKHKETGYQKGKKNSQWETCWITKNKENKKIKKKELHLYEKDGWTKGKYDPSPVCDSLKYEEIVEDIKTLSLKEIGSKYGVHHHTVAKFLKRNNIKNPRSPL